MSAVRIGSALIATACLLGASAARAEIVFCNKFGHEVYVAIAYPQRDGSYISRGWMSLSNDTCAPFDTALRLSTFYFRGESVPYRGARGRRLRFFWGKGEKFAIWERDNFQYYNARKRVLKSTLVEFTQGPKITGNIDNVSLTVSFTPNGSVVSTKMK